MNEENDEIISIKDAAKILHISYTLLVKLIRSDDIDIPYAKIANRVKFRRKDVQEYIDNKFGKHNTKNNKEGEGA